MDEEQVRRQYQDCDNCGADLSGWKEWLTNCPLCGGELKPNVPDRKMTGDGGSRKRTSDD